MSQARTCLVSMMAGSVALVVAVVSGRRPIPSAGAKAAPTKANDKPWTAPKTPWGDPDLQGTWTTDSAFGIPLNVPSSSPGVQS